MDRRLAMRALRLMTMRLIRLIVGCAVVASASLVPAPSSACYGEICDGICYVTTTISETTPGEKFDFTSCPR
ncbi:MAG: hypothetical protein ACRDJM_04735 [Actinomycetota bacterium]